MTLISFLIAVLVGLLSYSIGYNTYRIRRKRTGHGAHPDGKTVATDQLPSYSS